MSVPAVESDTCPVCGGTIVDAMARCPACGYDLAGLGQRPLMTKPVFWWTAMGFLVVYLVTLAIVVLRR